MWEAIVAAAKGIGDSVMGAMGQSNAELTNRDANRINGRTNTINAMQSGQRTLVIGLSVAACVIVLAVVVIKSKK